jgi:acetyl-CoA acetyltransferase
MVGTARQPAKDRVAIASAASTGFRAENTDRSQLSYVADASIAALRAAGLSRTDVDGIVGSPDVTATQLQRTIGIPAVTFFANPPIPFINQLSVAAAAIHSGQCEVVLAYHAAYRLPWNTGSAVQDPFRRPAPTTPTPPPEATLGALGYAAWASRYLHEFGADREALGLVAINARSNAARNPVAAMRKPLTMQEYLAHDPTSTLPVRHGYRGRRWRRVRDHHRGTGS